MKLFQIPVFKPVPTRFFIDTISATIKHRVETGAKRNDIVDLMVEALKGDDDAAAAKGSEKNEHGEEQFEKDQKFAHGNKKKSKEFDEQLTVIATAMIILVAGKASCCYYACTHVFVLTDSFLLLNVPGYDTTAQTMSFVCYELAKYPEIQRRLQDEIDDAIEKAGGKMPDYSTIQGLEYTEQVIMETLRYHSLIGIFQRGCTQDYKIPGVNFTIPKGMEVHFNAIGVHQDERY